MDEPREGVSDASATMKSPRGWRPEQVAVPAARMAGSLPSRAEADLRAVAESPLSKRPAMAARWAQRTLEAGLRPDPSLLDDSLTDYQPHLIFRDPIAELSVEWLVWGGGSATPIHAHRCWCVVAVAEGSEGEIHYARAKTGEGELVVTRQRMWEAGESYIRLPPNDIHQVFNAGSGLAVSLHVYGVDIARVGTSIERIYDPRDAVLGEVS
ncbi:MAG: cysteine dioxygenase family protein [Acidimicrobiales bacterium]